jgi:hypothetical protein
LIYFKTQTAETIPVICGTASFYARKTADFPGIKGKESCKKWHRSFFYVKNLKEGADHVNLPPFDVNGPTRDNWSVPLPRPSPDMEKILQQISTMQTEGDLEPADLLLAFVVARVSPLQHRSHKMCFLGSAKDPTRHSSRYCRHWRWRGRLTVSPTSSFRPCGSGAWSLMTEPTQLLR